MNRVRLLAATALALALWATPAAAAPGDLVPAGCLGSDASCTHVTPPTALAHAIAPLVVGSNLYMPGTENNPDSARSLGQMRITSAGDLVFQRCYGPLAGCTDPPLQDGALAQIVATPSGGDVYVLYQPPFNGTQDRAYSSIIHYTRAGDGSLTYVGCVGRLVDCAQTTPALDNSRKIAISPDGRQLYALGESTDGHAAVFTFNLVGGTHALTYARCLGDRPGCAPLPSPVLNGSEDMAMSPDGGDLYATANAGTGHAGLTVLRRDPGTGVLTFKTCLRDDGGCQVPGGRTGLADAVSNRVTVSADSQRVYTMGYHGSIASFVRDTATGALSLGGCLSRDVAGCDSSVDTTQMWNVVALTSSPDGQQLYASRAYPSGGDGAVEVFRRAGASLAYQSCVGAPARCTAGPLSRGLAFSADGVRAFGAGTFADGSTYGQGSAYVYRRKVVPSCSSVGTTTNYQTSVVVHLACSSGDGDPITFHIASAPAHGTVTVNASTGAATYTPANGYSGLDSFTFTASDPDGTSQAASAAVGVRSASASGTPPTCSDVSGVHVAFQQPASIAYSCTNPGGTGISYLQGTESPSHGTISSPDAGGHVTYTPDPGYSGPDTFTYGAVNASDVSNEARVSLTVDAPPAPERLLAACRDVSASTQADVSVALTLDCTDPDGDLMTFAVTRAPAHGTLGPIGPDGSARYTPDAGYGGADSFNYRVTEPDGASNTATASLQIRGGGEGDGQPPAATGPAAPTGTPVAAPRITRLTVSPRRLRPRHTTTIALTLAGRPARVLVTMQRVLVGHRRGRVCTTRRGAHGARCTKRKAVRGRLTVTGRLGINRVRFAGRLGKSRLPRGTYRVTATPDGGRGASATLIVA